MSFFDKLPILIRKSRRTVVARHPNTIHAHVIGQFQFNFASGTHNSHLYLTFLLSPSGLVPLDKTFWLGFQWGPHSLTQHMVFPRVVPRELELARAAEPPLHLIFQFCQITCHITQFGPIQFFTLTCPIQTAAQGAAAILPSPAAMLLYKLIKSLFIELFQYILRLAVTHKHVVAQH